MVFISLHGKFFSFQKICTWEHFGRERHCSDVSSTIKSRLFTISIRHYLSCVTRVPVQANSFSASSREEIEARAQKEKEKNDGERGNWENFFPNVRMAMLAMQATLHHLQSDHNSASKTG